MIKDNGYSFCLWCNKYGKIGKYDEIDLKRFRITAPKCEDCLILEAI